LGYRFTAFGSLAVNQAAAANAARMMAVPMIGVKAGIYINDQHGRGGRRCNEGNVRSNPVLEHSEDEERDESDEQLHGIPLSRPVGGNYHCRSFCVNHLNPPSSAAAQRSPLPVFSITSYRKSEQGQQL
jgi:hypothetical protein